MNRDVSGLRCSVLVWSTVAIGAILTVLEHTALVRIKSALLADPGVHSYQSGLLSRVLSVLPVLRPFDWALVAALAALCGTACVLEWRRRRLSSELERILDTERGTLLFLVLVSVVACRFYLGPGEFALGDSPSHVARVYAVAESLAQGHWPSWSFLNYGGFPLLQFYGSALFVIAGAFAVVCGGALWPTKLLLFALHAASSVPMYGWGRAAGLSRPGAMLAATAYVLSFVHTHTVIWTGALPVALVFLAFPVALWAIECLFAVPARRWVWVLALSIFLTIGAHHGYAVYALECLVAYTVLRVAFTPDRAHSVRVAVVVLVSIAGGVMMGAGPLLRVTQEGAWVHLPRDLPLLRPAIPRAAFWEQLLVWKSTWSGWTVAYMGISVALFAVAGATRAFLGDARVAAVRSTRVMTALSILALCCSAASGRVINLALAPVVFVAGGVASPQVSARAFLVLLAVLAADLGPTTIQSPYRTDRAWLSEGMHEIGRAVEPHRVLEGFFSGGAVSYFHWGAYADRDVIVPTGFFPQGGPQSLAAINALIDALNAPDVDATTKAALLFQWDVAALAVHARDKFVTASGEPVASGDPPFISIPSSPLLFAPRAVTVQDDSLYALQECKLEFGHTASDSCRRSYLQRLTPWIRTMHVEPATGTARVLLARAGLPPAAVSRLPLVETPSALDSIGDSGDVRGVEVRDYRVDMRRVEITLQAMETGFVQLAFSDYPTLRVRMDGNDVKATRSLLGTMIVPVTPGTHSLLLTPTAPWRWKSLALVVGGALVVLVSQLTFSRVRLNV